MSDNLEKKAEGNEEKAMIEELKDEQLDDVTGGVLSFASRRCKCGGMISAGGRCNKCKLMGGRLL